MNQNFEKVTEELPEINGKQKAAILLSEIGAEDKLLKQQIMDLLQLTPKEVKELSQSYKTLGIFNRHNKKVVARENLVLEETIEYGKRKGIFVPVQHDRTDPETAKIRDMVQSNPDSIAKLIGSWLSE